MRLVLSLVVLAACAGIADANDHRGLFGVRGRMADRRAGTVVTATSSVAVRGAACPGGVCPAVPQAVPKAQLPGFAPVAPKK